MSWVTPEMLWVFFFFFFLKRVNVLYFAFVIIYGCNDGGICVYIICIGA